MRYRLAANVVFTWQAVNGSRLVGEGVTRDISSGGIFTSAPTCPPVGAIVQLDVLLPSARQDANRTIRMNTEAKVIRVEHSSAGEGFAATTTGFEMLFDKTKTGNVTPSNPNMTGSGAQGE